MQKVLVVVDMQNDFIDGALGSAQAQAVVPRIEAKIVASKKDADQETDLIFTQDTHDEAYSETQEGRKLPVPHCLKDTRGWRICKQLLPYTLMAEIFEKPSFGCPACARSLARTRWKSRLLTTCRYGESWARFCMSESRSTVSGCERKYTGALFSYSRPAFCRRSKKSPRHSRTILIFSRKISP